MVEKEMVAGTDDRFVKAVTGVVNRLETSHGPLYAAILAHVPDRLADDWVLLVGSNKLSQRRLNGIHAIVKAMKGAIPNEYSTRIRRVDILRLDDPVYMRLSRAFNMAPGAPAELVSCNVLGLEIDHAFLFVMQRLGESNDVRKEGRRRTKKRHPARA